MLDKPVVGIMQSRIFPGRIQIVSEYLGEESFRLIGCFVSLVLSRCCGMELKGERSES